MALMQRKESVKRQRASKYKKAAHILANAQWRDKSVYQKQGSDLELHTTWRVQSVGTGGAKIQKEKQN